MHPLAVLFVAIALVFLLIIRFKINAFIALIVAAATVGLLSPHIRLPEVMPKVAGLFGTVCGRIAIVIALAALVGQAMMESGAADKIVRVFVRWLGESRASLSLIGSSYVLATPVFFDTVFYLLVPLARAMRIRTGRNYVLYVCSIAAGGATAHSLIPPTPGPLAMAATLHVDLGLMILVGAIIGVPAALAGWLVAQLLDRKLNIPFREAPGLSLEELEELARRDDKTLPGFFHSLAPILLPVALITSNTFVQALRPESPLARLTAFIGDPNFALLCSAVVGMHLLVRHRHYSLAELARPVETAFASAGLIILITAGGGAFGGMLVEAGVGKWLGNVSQQFQVPLLILGFLLAALMKVAQGSGTVSMITTSAILAPLAAASQLPCHPVYLATAIGSGSMVGSWMNDSGFWVFAKMSGLEESETLQTWTVVLIVLGVAGLLATLAMAALLPLR